MHSISPPFHMSICCLLLYEVILPSEAPLHFAPVTVRLVTTTFDCLSLLLLLLLTLCCPVNESCEQIMVHPQTIFFFNGKMSLKTKLNEKKRTKKVRVYAEAVWSFQWFSMNFFFTFRLFKGANTACRSVMACEAVRASRSASRSASRCR